MRQEEDSPLVAEILSGENRGLQLLAARGLVPLPPAELVAVQVELAASSDEEISSAAATSVGEHDPKIVASLVADGLSSQVLSFLTRNFDHPLVQEGIIRSREATTEQLVELAGRVEERVQEVLLLRQDAIVDAPEILEALAANPRLGKYARRKIGEYREHLLPRERRPRKSRAEIEAEAEALTSEEIAEAIAEAKEAPAAGEEDELTGLTESQIRTLAVPVRIKLARGAPKVLRNILVRDPNPLVSTAVLHHNALGDSEIEQIANNKAVAQEVLEVIGNNRSWVRKYPVIVALVKNPRAPVGMAMRLLPRLAVRDLQGLVRDRNVANAIRSGAKRLYTMKRS